MGNINLEAKDIQHEWQMIECFWESAKCRLDHQSKHQQVLNAGTDSFKASDEDDWLNESACYSQGMDATDQPWTWESKSRTCITHDSMAEANCAGNDGTWI